MKIIKSLTGKFKKLSREEQNMIIMAMEYVLVAVVIIYLFAIFITRGLIRI